MLHFGRARIVVPAMGSVWAAVVGIERLWCVDIQGVDQVIWVDGGSVTDR